MEESVCLEASVQREILTSSEKSEVTPFDIVHVSKSFEVHVPSLLKHS